MDPAEYASKRVDSTTGVGKGNRYEKYLGPVANNVNISAYDDVAYTNYDLPEYYRGKNLFLKNTIDGFIMDDIEFYTTVALPWGYTDQLRVTYNEWRFNAVYADRVPHEGVSRLVTTSKGEFNGQVVRRGLAFLLEGDFYTTPEGDQQYMRNVRGIAQCVQETQNYDTLYALLTCKDQEKIRTQRFGIAPFSKVKIYEEGISDYNCMLQEPETLDRHIERWKGIMSRNKAYPDTIILPPGASLYLKTQEPQQTAYWGLSPSGGLEFKAGPPSVSSFRGLDAFETRDFEVYRNEPLVNLMARPVQIGERYHASFKDHRSKDIYDYSTAWRNVVLYNENKDAVGKVLYLDMFGASNIFLDGDHHPAATKALNDFNEGHRPNNKRRGRGSKVSDDDTPPFVSISKDSNNVGFLIDVFGQMDLKFVDTRDIMQMAQSVLGKIYGRHHMEKEERIMTDLWDLIKDIESEPYNREFVRLVIEENIPYSVDAEGNFVGESTPSDVLQYWHNLSQVTQWKPNVHGSLRLPSKKPEGMSMPLGCNNWAAILTISYEGDNPRSPWHELGVRCKKIVKMWKTFANQLISLLPGSEAVLPEARSPWFHKADACATLFDYVIGVKRDPIFLAALPLVKKGKSIEGEPFGKKKKAVGRVSPLYSLDLNYGDLVAKDALQLMKDAMEGKELTEDQVVFMAPNGTVVTSETVEFRSGLMMSKAVVALRLMGKNSYPALFELIQRLTPAADAAIEATEAAKLKETKKKLLNYVLKLGSIPDNVPKLRASVRSLHALGLEELINTVNVIDITSEATQKVQGAAKRKIESLAKKFMDAPDEDIDAFVNHGITDPLKVVGDSVDDDNIAGASQVSDLFDDAIEFADQLNAIRIAKGQTRQALNLGNIDNFKSGLPALAELRGRYEDILTALNDVSTKYKAVIKEYSSNEISVEDWEDREGALPKKGKAKKVYVQDDDSAVRKARWYRCPLTMSPGLAESLYDEELPLLRPSDPDTGHLLPAAGEEDYDRIFKGTSYLSLDSLVISKENLLESTNFALRHMSENSKSKPRYSDHKKRKTETPRRRGAKTKGDLLADSDFDESELSEDSSSEDDLGGYDHRRRSAKGSASSTPIYSDKYKQVTCGAMQHRYKEVRSIPKSILRIATICALMAPFDEESIVNMIKNDVYVPIDFILWRVGIEHDMESAIIMKRGFETGANLYGHSNFATGNDVATKMIYGNFTFNSKAMVWKEKNVQIIPNIRSKEYRGGNNLDFAYDEKDLEERGRERPSIICTAIPVTETDFEFAMDITGRDRMADLNESIDTKNVLHYSSAPYYERIFKFGRRTSGVHTDKFTYFDEQERENTLAFQGLQVNYNIESRKYDRVVLCQGHRKMNGSGPGCAALWNGKGTYFKEQRFETWSFD